MEYFTVFIIFCGFMFCAVKPSLIIPKCCYKGEILDSSFIHCVSKNGTLPSTVESEDFQSPVDNETIYWLPDKFRELNITVLYGFKYMVNYDVVFIKAFDTESGFRIVEEETSTILKKRHWYCFDETEDPVRPRVLFKGLMLETIPKCCDANEVLNAGADACIRVNEHTINNTWFPKLLWSPDNSTLVAKSNVNYMRDSYKFNQLFQVKDGLQVKFVPGEQTITTIHFNGVNGSGIISEGATDLFCFDLLQEGNISSQVLLAAVYQLNKCCGKGEYMPRHSECTRLPDVTVEDVTNEFIDWKENKRIHDWIPKAFHETPTSVHYNSMNRVLQNARSGKREYTTFIFHEKMWTFQFRNHSLPLISADIRYLNGQIIPVRSTQWCIGKAGDYFLIVLGGLKPRNIRIRKCCDPGEIFSPGGYCEKHNGDDWSPKTSTVRELFNSKGEGIPEENIATSQIQLCNYEPYNIHSLHSTESLRYYRDELIPEEVLGAPSLTFYCLEFQRTPHGVKEVVGSCTMPPNAFSYAAARPVLGLAAAILLVAAGVVALAREDTRRSAHGRALVCHALSLAAANILQVTVFFLDDRRSKICFYFAYTIYFFMVAANSWLTAITFNMVHNFRKPLGALARSPTASSVWRRFGAMSAFAWGVTTGLTTLAVTMHRHRVHLSAQDVASPTFSETRSCGFEIDFTLVKLITLKDDNGSYGHRYGALFYYFIPMLVLVSINGVSVVLTIRRVRDLGKDSAFIQGGGSGNIALKNAMLYVKLMITSGFIELILEVASWASQSNQRLTFMVPTYVKRAYTFRLIAICLDLFRAISMLWLCMGTWCRMGALWSHVRARLGVVSQMAVDVWNRCRKYVTRHAEETIDIPMESTLTNDQS